MNSFLGGTSPKSNIKGSKSAVMREHSMTRSSFFSFPLFNKWKNIYATAACDKNFFFFLCSVCKQHWYESSAWLEVLFFSFFVQYMKEHWCEGWMWQEVLFLSLFFLQQKNIDARVQHDDNFFFMFSSTKEHFYESSAWQEVLVSRFKFQWQQFLWLAVSPRVKLSRFPILQISC